MEGEGPEAWYRRLPSVTKIWISVVFGLTLLSSLGALSPVWLLLDWREVFGNFQIWRIFTNVFFVGPFGISWIFYVMVLSQFSAMLEKHPTFCALANRRDEGGASPGAYLWFLVLQTLMLAIVSLCIFWPHGRPALAESLLVSLTYYWSRKEPYAPVSIYFFTIQAYQLPWALLGFHLLIGAGLWSDLMGIGCSHTYYFFRDLWPLEGGYDFLGKCPRFMDSLITETAKLTQPTPAYQPPPRPNTPNNDPNRPQAQNRNTNPYRNISDQPQAFAGPGRRLGD